MNARAWILALSFFAVAASPSLAAADDARQERAFKLVREAKKHIRNSRKHTRNSRMAGENQGKENEKAIIKLEEATRLLEREVEDHPDQPSLLEELQNTAAMLFWCHKMAPVSTERKEAFDKRVKEEDAKIHEEAKKEGAGSEEDLARAFESRASLAFEKARDYEKAARAGDVDRRVEVMTRYFQIADRYSATRVAIKANKESLRLQKEISTGPGEIVEKAQGDARKFRRVASRYLAAREKLVCDGCRGRGKIPCRPCKGKGWKLRYYSNGHVDWPLCKRCRRCNPTGQKPALGSPEPRNGPDAGVQVCNETHCTYGLKYRPMRTLFWELVDRTEFERRQVKLEKMPEKAFLETLAAVMNPRTDEETLKKALAQASRFVSLDEELLLEAMKDIAEVHAHTLKPFNGKPRSKIAKSGRVTATFQIYKPKSSFEEEILFVWSNKKWWFKKAE